MLSFSSMSPEVQSEGVWLEKTNGNTLPTRNVEMAEWCKSSWVRTLNSLACSVSSAICNRDHEL